MQLPELRMSFADRALLTVEVEQSLRCGRAFLSQPSPVPVLTDCVLVLVHPEHGGELRLPAQVVMANEHGTGLSLTTLTAQHLSELNAFADSSLPPTAAADAAPAEERTATLQPGATTTPPPGATTPPPGATMPPAATLPPGATMPPAATLPPTAAGDLDSGQGLEEEQDAQPLESAESSADSDSDPLDCADDSLDSLDFPRSDEQDLEYGSEPASGSSRPVELQTESRQDRLRHLSAAEQVKVARRGELADRLAVERLYGKQVWEALLQNPRLTIPEVARIARKGTVPKPLLDIILDNPGWIKADAVRRALLTNPRIGAESVMKLLRITSKHELKLIEKGTAYGVVVRETARKLLRQ
jgi:hypothetical protein